MASPRRARSLFLSPDKAELLAAREVNNLVHRIEVVPRKSVPRQGRRTNIVVQTESGRESRMSTTSTIKAVETFCSEYRPPSVALHRLSYLNKDLPPPPPPETPTEKSHQSIAVSRTSTQKNAAAQTIISIQSRYSTRIKPSSPSRLSIISSQERDSEDRISIRSRFSTQEFATDDAVARSEPQISVGIDRRQLPDGEDRSKKDARRKNSGAISPGTLPHHETAAAVDDRGMQTSGLREVELASGNISPRTVPQHEIVSLAAGREIEVSGLREVELDSRALQIVPQEPLVSTQGKDIVPRSMSGLKISSSSRD